MRRPRCLFVVSRDFGEYVTAQLFTRGQALDARFAVPATLAPFVDAEHAATYRDVADLEALSHALQPDFVLLCSGYLFAVNNLISPAALAHWLAALRGRGVTVATTDPWLALDDASPGAGFSVTSVRQGGIVPGLSEAMARLHAQLRALFAGLPHVYAVPMERARPNVYSFFNPRFVADAPAAAAGEERWVFVLSREDHAYLEGFGGDAFRARLEHHVARLAAPDGQRVTFVGPPALAPFFSGRFPEGKVEYSAFCTATAFERTLREASVVGYWNVLSSSLLYCMYYRVPPVFFGAGHQVKIRAGLYDHAVQQVYGGDAPRMLDWQGTWPAEPYRLVSEFGIAPWLDQVAARHERSPAPEVIVEAMMSSRASEPA